MQTRPAFDSVELSYERTPNVMKLLEQLDAQFSLKGDINYLNGKVALLHQYCQTHNLTALVLGVSGGIDSAVALGILAELVSKYPEAYRVFPVFVSDHLCEQSMHFAQLAADAFGFELLTAKQLMNDQYDLWASAYRQINGVNEAFNTEWSDGQAVSYRRQSLLYGLTAGIKDMYGDNAIVVGTINRDEGSYLGYTCKAGDGMVDVQLISDLFKSEVRALAYELGVPHEIIDRAPQGDMYDGRSDADVFGACYATSRLFHHILHLNTNHNQANAIAGVDVQRPELNAALIRTLFEECTADERATVFRGFSNLERLHGYNAHKYLVGSPAVYLDMTVVDVNNGRRTRSVAHELVYGDHAQPLTGTVWSTQINRQLTLPSRNVLTVIDSTNKMSPRTGAAEAFYIRTQLPDDVIAAFKERLDDSDAFHTDRYGKRIERNGEGSRRNTFKDNNVADLLTNAIRPMVPQIIVSDNGSVWRFVGCNPYIRAMEYGDGAELHPHYDTPHVYGPGVRNMFSVVLYLTTCFGGETVLIEDRSDVKKEPNGDWTRQYDPELDEEIASFSVRAGHAAIFRGDKMLHASMPVVNGVKQVLLTEAAYELIHVPNAQLMGNEDILEALAATFNR